MVEVRRAFTFQWSLTQFTGPLHHVGVLLEVRDADAEVVQLVGELGSELVNESLVNAIQAVFRHQAGDELSHLVAGHLAVAAERAVAIALDDAVGSELRHSIVGPVAGRQIGERVRCSKRRAGSAHDESRRECGCKCFLHEKSLLYICKNSSVFRVRLVECPCFLRSRSRKTAYMIA